jgi:hypothetical protein
MAMPFSFPLQKSKVMMMMTISGTPSSHEMI